MKFTRLFATILPLLLLPGAVRAEIWDGSTHNLWGEATNWNTPEAVPDAAGASVILDRALMATPGNAVLDLGGAPRTVGNILIDTVTAFSVDFNNGTIVFDNNGSTATWDVETVGTAKTTVTTKGTASVILSDDLVINSQSTQQFRPSGSFTDAASESHSVTYTSRLTGGNAGFKLSWAASNTGGTIVDSGQIRSNVTSLDSRIGLAASGPDLLLKNDGRIYVGENISHTLSRTVEIGSGGGRFVSDAADFLTFSGVISGSGPLTISKGGAGVATVNLTGVAANTLNGNVVLDNPQTVVGQDLLVVADKVGALGQTPLLSVGKNTILQITTNAVGGEGAIDDDATLVQLSDVNSVFDVASGVDEQIGGGKLEVFNGSTYDTIAPGTYNSSETWITGAGTITVLGAVAPAPKITAITLLGNGDVVLTLDGPAAGLTAQHSDDLTVSSFSDVASTPSGNTLTIDSSLVDPNTDDADYFRVRN